LTTDSVREGGGSRRGEIYAGAINREGDDVICVGKSPVGAGTKPAPATGKRTEIPIAQAGRETPICLGTAIIKAHWPFVRGGVVQNKKPLDPRNFEPMKKFLMDAPG